MNAYKKIKYILNKVQDSKVLFNNILTQLLYVRVRIYFTCGRHLHDRSISLRGEVPVNKTSLTLPRLEKRLYQVI